MLIAAILWRIAAMLMRASGGRESVTAVVRDVGDVVALRFSV
jgi:hypothetical protein